MGLFRKLTSVSTLGAVDFRSDKERIASYTKATKSQAKQQTKIMRRAEKADALAEAERKLAAVKAYKESQRASE